MVLGSFAAVLLAILPAPVAPQDCGRMELRGRTTQIKADGLRCTTARRWSKTYVVDRRAPSGWTCRRYSSTSTALAFRCRRGGKTFFGIRRG